MIANERHGTAYGVKGRFGGVVMWPDDHKIERCRGRIANQEFTASAQLPDGEYLEVVVRFDDKCQNGHETLALTATRYGLDRRLIAGGCMHDEIAEVFPEFAPLIPYHLCSTDGPLHYIANTLFLAGNRDHNGLLRGEESPNPRTRKHRVTFGDSPIEHDCPPRLLEFLKSAAIGNTEVIIDKVDHPRDPKLYGSKFQFVDMDCDWHQCPFDTYAEAERWAEAVTTLPMHIHSRATVFGEGKERELDAARRAAIWPDATDDELCSDRLVLESLLKSRLPSLMDEFKRLVEGFGFIYSAEEASCLV